MERDGGKGWRSAVASTVLVVEDNPIAGEIVETVLRSRGHEVVLTGTGRGGVEWLGSHGCELILLDLMLPDADGGQLVEVFRRLLKGEKTPILAFSAFATRLEELKRSGAPFDDYVSKPVEPEDLIRIVEGWLGVAGGKG